MRHTSFVCYVYENFDVYVEFDLAEVLNVSWDMSNPLSSCLVCVWVECHLVGESLQGYENGAQWETWISTLLFLIGKNMF